MRIPFLDTQIDSMTIYRVDFVHLHTFVHYSVSYMQEFKIKSKPHINYNKCSITIAWAAKPSNGLAK